MSNATLRRALVSNAAFSGLTGLTALTFAGRLAETLGPPAWSLRALGIGLLAFAVLIARETPAPRRSATRQIIAADLAWVAAAAFLIAIAPAWLTDGGRVALATVTLVVAVVAVAQWRGLKAIGSTPAVRSPDVEAPGSPGDGLGAHSGSSA